MTSQEVTAMVKSLMAVSAARAAMLSKGKQYQVVCLVHKLAQAVRNDNLSTQIRRAAQNGLKALENYAPSKLVSAEARRLGNALFEEGALVEDAQTLQRIKRNLDRALELAGQGVYNGQWVH